MTPTDRSPTELVQYASDALNDRDRNRFVELHADDIVVYSTGEQFRGVDAVVSEEFDIFDGFSELTYSIEALLSADGTVAARWTASGIHDGTFNGIQPTDEPVEFPVTGMFRNEDGQIAEVWVLPDRFELSRQLGAVEPPTG